jgi:hypothetical protein
MARAYSSTKEPVFSEVTSSNRWKTEEIEQLFYLTQKFFLSILFKVPDDSLGYLNNPGIFIFYRGLLGALVDW